MSKKIEIDDEEVAFILNQDGTARLEMNIPDTEEDACNLMAVYAVLYGIIIKMKNNEDFIAEVQLLGKNAIEDKYAEETGKGTLQ